MAIYHSVTQTAEQARERIDDARHGSLAETPSLDYLYTLLDRLDSWRRAILVEVELAELREARKVEEI